MEISTKIRLSLQKSLIGNLSSSVRGICCDWADDYAWFRLRFYLDKKPNEIDKELLSVVLTEFECDIQDFKKIYDDCIFSKKNYNEIEKLRMIILWRNE
jgi:hypothetical protein